MDPEKKPHIVNLKDEKTFEFIFRSHYAQLASFAIGYVGDKDEAEEIVQETFSKIWTRHEILEIKTSIKSYLYGAIRNACLNYLKHQAIKQKYVERQSGMNPSQTTDFLELDELTEKIKKGMDKLPKKCREIFELSRYEGLRYQEIADHLGLSIKTVENQMGNALRILREELGEYQPFVLWLMADMGVNLKMVVQVLGT